MRNKRILAMMARRRHQRGRPYLGRDGGRPARQDRRRRCPGADGPRRSAGARRQRVVADASNRSAARRCWKWRASSGSRRHPHRRHGQDADRRSRLHAEHQRLPDPAGKHHAQGAAVGLRRGAGHLAQVCGRRLGERLPRAQPLPRRQPEQPGRQDRAGRVQRTRSSRTARSPASRPRRRATSSTFREEAIVNDDLSAFVGLASALGRAAKRTVEVDVYATWR